MPHENAHDSMPVDVPLVRRLISDQFPDWAHLPINPVESQGHDNRTFRLGETMSVRLPSADRYAASLETERLWLPRLGPHLPLPIPTPLAMGAPAHGYPWQWSINTWVIGENAALGHIDDPNQFAEDLAHFLNALQRIDAHGGPTPGRDNFFRGGDPAVYDAQTRACIDALCDVVDPRAAGEVWASALDAHRSGPDVWVHGDMAAGNLLVKGGRLSAVIDFGQLAVGDPACDVTIAWTFFSGAGRRTFRAKLSVDESTWLRGRGWGLWKALLELQRHRHANAAEAAKVMRVIDDILAD
jgi:aminoglycoside phosphotransferase (APT) family kinase protein